jgi:hypothetical protein
VQTVLAENRITAQTRQSTSGALLAGKLRDDRDNRMSPSFTVKSGVRYRFYVSRAVLQDRKSQAGSAEVVVHPKKITISLQPDSSETIEVQRQGVAKNRPTPPPPSINTNQPNPKFIQAVVRAHAWLRDLQNNKFETVEALAASVTLHPKVVQQELRYAFLAPAITEAILTGEQPPTLARIPKTLPLTWVEYKGRVVRDVP